MRVLALLVFALPAFGADLFYLGTWKITSAVVVRGAPLTRKPDQTEMKTLVGKSIVVKANEITGPRQWACKGPRYKLVDSPADFLFQGAFGEMHLRDKSADPVKIAAKLGFQGSSWKTLETGGANELDLHFVNDTTGEFGLNDYVYTMKKQ